MRTHRTDQAGPGPLSAVDTARGMQIPRAMAGLKSFVMLQNTAGATPTLRHNLRCPIDMRACMSALGCATVHWRCIGSWDATLRCVFRGTERKALECPTCHLLWMRGLAHG